MNSNLKLKDIYDSIPEDEPVYPLQIWYNTVIEKKESDLDVSDVLRMLRQKMFLEVAIDRTILLLTDDPFACELYEGDLFEHLSKMSKEMLKPYSERIKDIIHLAEKNIDKKDEWVDEDDKKEFMDSIENLKNML